MKCGSLLYALNIDATRHPTRNAYAMTGRVSAFTRAGAAHIHAHIHAYASSPSEHTEVGADRTVRDFRVTVCGNTLGN